MTPRKHQEKSKEERGILEKGFQKYGLKLQPDKSQLFQKEVKFLGHCVSAAEVSEDQRCQKYSHSSLK